MNTQILVKIKVCNKNAVLILIHLQLEANSNIMKKKTNNIYSLEFFEITQISHHIDWRSTDTDSLLRQEKSAG